MGTTPIPRLVIKMSISLIISLLVNNPHSLVSSIFVSHVSEDVLTGISIMAPLQMLMVALGCGLAVGLDTMVSKVMGRKQPGEVKETTSAVIVMAFGAYLVNVVACLLLVEPYFAWQAGRNEVTMRYGTSYIRICMFFSFGQVLQWVFDQLLIAMRRSNLFLATLGTASLVNVVLDPILILEYFDFPVMGAAGAAVATVTGQLAGGLLGIYLDIKGNEEILVHFTLHIQKKYVASILKIGTPTTIVQGVMSVMGIFTSTILYQFSPTAVVIYGIPMKVQSLVQTDIQGMNNGLIPAIAYNYGAGKERRIHEAIRCAFLYAVTIVTVVLISLELTLNKTLMLFDASEQTIRLGIPAARIMSISFFVPSVRIILTTIFRGSGDGNYDTCFVLMRQVILLVPIFLTGAAMGNITAIWSGFAVAETLFIPSGTWLYGKVT